MRQLSRSNSTSLDEPLLSNIPEEQDGHTFHHEPKKGTTTMTASTGDFIFLSHSPSSQTKSKVGHIDTNSGKHSSRGRGSSVDSSCSIDHEKHKIVRRQSWLVPPEACSPSSNLPAILQKKGDERGEGSISIPFNSSSSLSSTASSVKLSAVGGFPTRDSAQSRKNDSQEFGDDGDDTLAWNERFVIDSLRLCFVNDPQVEEDFRERFFNQQTGHRPWTSPMHCLPEIFTNMTVALICIELIVMIAIAASSHTTESQEPYFREFNGSTEFEMKYPDLPCHKLDHHSTCYVVLMRKITANYEITHGFIVSLLMFMVILSKNKDVRKRLIADGAVLWQWLASATLTGCCFALLTGFYFSWGVDDAPQFHRVENIPMPLSAQAMIVEFYSLLLVFSCASGVCFWRVLWGNFIAMLTLAVLQFRSNRWLRAYLMNNRQGAETLYIWFLINSFLTILSYRNELQLRIAYIQTRRLEEANLEVTVRMRSLQNPFSIARIEEYMGMSELPRSRTNTITGASLIPDLREYTGEWTLDFRRLRFGTTIAKGGGGIVWRGRYFDEIVAIKQVFAGRNSKNPILGGNLKAFANEVSVLHKLSTGAVHPGLVRLMGICKSESNDLFFVMEYCDCSLHDILVGNVDRGAEERRKGEEQTTKSANEDDEEKCTPEVTCGLESEAALKTLRRCARQTAAGMAYLHEKGISHRDLKPQNILVKRYGGPDPIQVKIADFGISRQGSNSGLTLHAGTQPFMPPELLDPEGLLGGPGIDPEIVRIRPGTQKKNHRQAITLDAAMKADVWSFGVTVAAMCLKSEPWPVEYAYMTLIRKICGGEKPRLPASCPGDIRALILRCMSQDPYRRPDFSYLEDTHCGFETPERVSSKEREGP